MTNMSDAELDALIPRIQYLKSWIASVENEIETRIVDGAAVFTNAFVASKQTRTVWASPERVIELAVKYKLNLDDVAPRSLRTPLQMSKILDPSIFEALSPYTEKKSSDPSLTLGKKAVKPSPSDIFNLED